MRKSFVLSLVVLLLLSVGPLTSTSHARSMIGQSLPDVTIKTLDGKDVVIREYVGSEEKPKEGNGTLIVFFNTACTVCRTELEHLAQFQDKGDVEILGISIDMRTAAGVPKFAEQLGVKFNILWDPKFDLGRNLGVYLTPASVYVDKTGKVVSIHKGFDPDIQAELDKLLQ